MYNYKKLAILLLSGFVVCNSGCSNEKTSEVPKATVIPVQKPTPTNTPTPINTPIPTPTNIPTPTSSLQDNQVLTFFKELETEVDNIILDNHDNIEKAKSLFISIVDFIFYDGEINNIKFKDLTNKGKEEVLKICSSIDSKLEMKFPNYKEKISDKTSEILNKASELIKVGSKNINEFLKNNLDEDILQSLNEAKNDIKNASKGAWNIIKEMGLSSWETGKEYIKNWWESIN